MTAALASSPWHRSPGSAPPAWRFAQVIEAASGPQVEWLLKRNCSLSPAQMFGVYLALCVISLTMALGFRWQGAPAILAFAGIELLLVGMALMVYARHASDQERICLAGEALAVEHRCGRQTERAEFRAAWVRVEPLSNDHSLIELTGDGQSSRVGRYLRPELRQPLAQELRAALRSHRHRAPNEFHKETEAK